MIRLVFRKPRKAGNFSIEAYFNAIFKNLKQSELDIVKYELPFFSNGILARFFNMLCVYFYKDDILHVTGDVHYVILFSRAKKNILTIHDCTFLENQKGIKYFILKTFWLTLPVKKSDIITTVSEATKKDIIKHTHCAPDKIKIIPVFSPLPIIHQPKIEIPGIPTVLLVGTAPNKNLETSIKACAGLTVKLSIIGILSEKQKKLLSENKINYTNQWNLLENEMAKTYSRADILLFPSLKEGFGMPIIEAQKAGIPVITSNCSSMPEVAGEGAFFVNPFKPEAIRNNLIELLENKNLRDLLVQKGHENRKRFKSIEICNEYIELYTKTGTEKPKNTTLLN